MSVFYDGRERQAKQLNEKHYDHENNMIKNKNCIDSTEINGDFVINNGDGSFFYNDVLHDQILYIDNTGNVYELE